MAALHTPQIRSAACCANCAHFVSDPEQLEDAIPGLRSLGSGFAAVRADDGLCLRHDRYLSAAAHCAQHFLRTTTRVVRTPVSVNS